MNGFRLGAFLRAGTLILLCLGTLILSAQELRDYEKKASEFTLGNGLHFILLERHQAPVVSFHTYVMAGSAQDPAGRTGLASLLARISFDGTESIGTKDGAAEKKALEELEAAYDRMDAERSKGANAGVGALATYQASADIATGEALLATDREEYRRAIQENGGVGLESHATPDSIEMSYSLPSNRIELWFLLESQRLAHPSFRDFYVQRNQLANDITSLMDGKSPAKLRQSLLSAAFEDLPYRNPVSGWPGDVANLRVADAKAFFDTYCGPGNTVISIVGDVDPTNARALADRYFGPIPARPHPPSMRTQEVPQAGPKSVAVWSDGQPLFMIGYKRPPETHRDDPALDLIATILGDSRTGWLHQELVEEKQIAQAAEVIASLPATRYTNLFVLSVTPANNHTVEENRKAVDGLVTRLQSRPVDAQTLSRAKNAMRARIARTFASNQVLAAMIPVYYANYGDWRKLFAVSADYDKLTAGDLQHVALLYLAPAGRTDAYLGRPQEPGSAASKLGGAQ